MFSISGGAGSIFRVEKLAMSSSRVSGLGSPSSDSASFRADDAAGPVVGTAPLVAAKPPGKCFSRYV